MPRYSKHEFQIVEWWLSQREGSPAWYATFYDAKAKRTRRVSLGTDNFEQARESSCRYPTQSAACSSSESAKTACRRAAFSHDIPTTVRERKKLAA